jgi:CRP-like cAMP-binding protein
MSATVSEWLLDEESFWEFMANKLLPVPRQDIPFLDGLNDDETRKVLRSGTILSAQANDTIIRAGEVGNELFVILSGLVEVRAAQTGKPIAVFEPGQVFGEIAFITNTTRSADVIALDDTEILVVTQNWLKRMMVGSPELASKVLLNLSRILCERLVVSTRTWVGSENMSSNYSMSDYSPLQ